MTEDVDSPSTMDPPPIDPPTIDSPSGIAIRLAGADTYVDVMRILEGALLEVDAAVVRSRIDAGDVLVAVDTVKTATVVAAIVLVPRGRWLHVEALAVSRRRRGKGIGSALVRATLRHAAERDFDRVTVAFDRDLRGFYADLGFAIGPIEEMRPQGDDRGEDGDRDGDRSTDDRLWGMIAIESVSDDRSP